MDCATRSLLAQPTEQGIQGFLDGLFSDGIIQDTTWGYVTISARMTRSQLLKQNEGC